MCGSASWLSVFLRVRRRKSVQSVMSVVSHVFKILQNPPVSTITSDLIGLRKLWDSRAREIFANQLDSNACGAKSSPVKKENVYSHTCSDKPRTYLMLTVLWYNNISLLLLMVLNVDVFTANQLINWWANQLMMDHGREACYAVQDTWTHVCTSCGDSWLWFADMLPPLFYFWAWANHLTKASLHLHEKRCDDLDENRVSLKSNLFLVGFAEFTSLSLLI